MHAHLLIAASADVLSVATVVASVVAALGVGGLVSALITARSQKKQQFREALLSASVIFADEAVQVVDHLKEIRPPIKSRTRNQPLVENVEVRAARLAQCADSIQEARTATGRILILCGPDSRAAKAAQNFYIYANDAYKAANSFYEGAADAADPEAFAEEKAQSFREYRNKAWGCLAALGREVSKRIG